MNIVDWLFGPFTVPFIARPMLVMAVLAVAVGVASVLVTLRSLQFVGDGLVHAVFPGIVVGFAIAGREGLLVGGMVAAALGAVARDGLDAKAGGGGEAHLLGHAQLLGEELEQLESSLETHFEKHPEAMKVIAYKRFADSTANLIETWKTAIQTSLSAAPETRPATATDLRNIRPSSEPLSGFSGKIKSWFRPVEAP